MSEERYTLIYEAVEPIVTLADPATLGGAPGEYDNQIQPICKTIYEGRPVDGSMLLRIFSADFPGCNVMSLEEFSGLAGNINNEIARLGPFGVRLSDALSIFRELDQVELDVAKQSGATFIIIPEVYSEDELLTAYQSQMRTMHGKNWDALDEVLVDCDNYENDVVYIVHHHPPRLPSRETAIYARILLGAIEDHNVGPRNGRVLPQRKIEFHVTFLAEGDDKREQLWGLLSDQA